MACGAPGKRRRNNGPVTATPTSKSPVPLHTIFTPPSSCNDIVTYDGTSLWQNGIHQTGDAACYPPSFSVLYQSFYTPGICPQSWKSVGSFAHTSGFNAVCCPSSYFLSTATANNIPGFNNFCASLMTTALSNIFSVASLKNGPAPSNPELITLAKAQVSSTTVYADAIQISWAPSNTAIVDLMEQQSAAAASKAAATPGSKNVDIPASTSSSSPLSRSSNGLSIGAKIGIGIGIPIAVIAIAALAIITLILTRRRKEKSISRSAIPMHHTKDSQYHELHPDYVGQSAPAEMDARVIAELPENGLRTDIGE